MSFRENHHGRPSGIKTGCPRHGLCEKFRSCECIEDTVKESNPTGFYFQKAPRRAALLRLAPQTAGMRAGSNRHIPGEDILRLQNRCRIVVVEAACHLSNGLETRANGADSWGDAFQAEDVVSSCPVDFDAACAFSESRLIV